VSLGGYVQGRGGRWSGLTQEKTAPIVNVVYLVMFGWWCGVLVVLLMFEFVKFDSWYV
jgi:hypothetical protein